MFDKYNRKIRNTYYALNGDTTLSFNPVKWFKQVIAHRMSRDDNQGWLDVIPFLYLYNVLDFIKALLIRIYLIAMNLANFKNPLLAVLATIPAAIIAAPFLFAGIAVGIAQVGLRAVTNVLAFALTMAAALTILPFVGFAASRKVVAREYDSQPFGRSTYGYMHKSGQADLNHANSLSGGYGSYAAPSSQQRTDDLLGKKETTPVYQSGSGSPTFKRF